MLSYCSNRLIVTGVPLTHLCGSRRASQWLGGVVVRALDLRLEIAGSIPAAALSSATLDKLFTHIVQRL